MTTALATTPINGDSLELVRRTLCKGLNADEFEMFVQVANRLQLDPFRRQIYAIKRGDKVTHQTSIDGFRVIAQRTGQYRGQEGPYWCGEDGQWTDVWLKKESPLAAKVAVWREGFNAPVWSVALLKSFKQNSPLWSSMPEHMLAKCAEALALRRAFPDELGGLYTAEEMDQADGPSAGPSQEGPAPGVAELISKEARAELVDLVKQLGWAVPHTQNWLKKHYGVSKSDQLSAAQGARAIGVLTEALVAKNAALTVFPEAKVSQEAE